MEFLVLSWLVRVVLLFCVILILLHVCSHWLPLRVWFVTQQHTNLTTVVFLLSHNSYIPPWAIIAAGRRKNYRRWSARAWHLGVSGSFSFICFLWLIWVTLSLLWNVNTPFLSHLEEFMTVSSSQRHLTVKKHVGSKSGIFDNPFRTSVTHVDFY